MEHYILQLLTEHRILPRTRATAEDFILFIVRCPGRMCKIFVTYTIIIDGVSTEISQNDLVKIILAQSAILTTVRNY